MNSQANPPSLILTRRLADGTVEWIPLEIPQRMPAAAEADYALIDRADYEAPQTLVARRQGEDLIVEVQGTEVLVLGGFFATPDVAFHPTTDIAGGAGPFSGTPLTPDSPVQAGSPAGEQVVWSAEPREGEPVGQSAEDGQGGGSSPLLWGGLAAGGLGLALAAGGGGGGGGGGGDGVGNGGGDDGGDGDGGGDGDPDDSAPVITSGADAAAIDENSGAGQLVYTAAATDDGTVTWSLADGGDAAAFSIDATTGEVTLADDPDFETQSSYDFTVVATDDAGNSSEQAVSLPINDIADTSVVSSVALTEADGGRNGILNAGDIVRVTVTTSENVTVDTAGGTPRIALGMGGTTVHADYVSGSGSTSLIFEYVIQPGDEDTNGISIQPNSLEPNGGSLTDASGNPVDLKHGPVTNDDAFLVDTTAPTLSSSTPEDDATDVSVDGDIVLTFSEDIEIGSGNITISNGSDSRTIDVTDTSQVSISGNQVTINPASDLIADSSYHVLIDGDAVIDPAGNEYAGISDDTTLNFDTPGADASIVVFDLVQGSSSDHSGRAFESDVTYDIYIRVDSDDASLSTEEDGPGTWGIWSGAANLGSDDRVILVGDGEAVESAFGAGVDRVSFDVSEVAWQSSPFLGFVAAAGVLQGSSFTRATGFDGNERDSTRLFDTSLPGDFLGGQGGELTTMYAMDMPPGILTSQGLV